MPADPEAPSDSRRRTYEQAESLLSAALDLPTNERLEFVTRRCGGDELLRATAVALLMAMENDDGELDRAAPGGGLRAATELTPDDASSRSLPRAIGPFQVLGYLGEGGMGLVYEAQQRRPSRRVAVKLLRPEHVTPALAQRFAREVELLGRLQHPGIVPILEAGRARPWGDAGREVPYLAMELIEGVPLTAHANGRRLGLDARVELLARVCDAVQHAHERGVLHRDLKPANILVERDGNPRVLDFGVARALDAPAASQTRTSQLIGTLQYMSPEQLAGSAEVGPAADIYALGVIAYELLAGRPPLAIAGLPLPEAIRKLQEADTQPLARLHPELRGDLSAIIGKALEKEPSRRYESAAAFAADLRRHLADEPILARPPSAFYRARKFVRRHRAATAVAALAMLTLVAASIVSSSLALNATRSRRVAEAARMAARDEESRVRLLSAWDALSRGDGRGARDLLEGVPADNRGWPWRHLFSRVDDSLAVLALPPTDFPASEARLTVLPDDRLAVGARGVAIVHVEGNGLKLERLLGPAFSVPEGRAGSLLEARDGGWWVHDVEDSRPPWRAGRSQTPPLALPDGGWLAWDGDVLLRLGADGTRLRELRPAGLVPEATLVSATQSGRWTLLRMRGDLWAMRMTSDVTLERLAGPGCTPAICPGTEIVCFADGPGRVMRRALEGKLPSAWNELRVGDTDAASLSFDPSGRILITVDWPRTYSLRTWDFDTGRLLARLPPTGRRLELWPLMRGGESLACSGDAAGAVRIVSLEDGRLREMLVGGAGPVSQVAVLPSERVAALDSHSELRLYPASGECTRELSGHRGFVYDVATDGKGSRLASVAWDGTIRIWKAPTGQIERVIAAGQAIVTHVALSRDGHVVAAITRDRGVDRRACAWNADTGALLACRPADAPVAILDGGDLLVGSADGVERWSEDLSRRAWRAEISRPQGVVIVPGGRDALVAGAHGVSRLDLADGRISWTQPEMPPGDRPMAVTPDGKTVIVGDQRVIEWLDAATGRSIAVATAGDSASVQSLAVDPDGSTLAVGLYDGSLELWDLPRRVRVTIWPEHQAYIHALVFAPDGSWLATASGDGTLKLLDTVPMRVRLAVGREP